MFRDFYNCLQQFRQDFVTAPKGGLVLDQLIGHDLPARSNLQVEIVVNPIPPRDVSETICSDQGSLPQNATIDASSFRLNYRDECLIGYAILSDELLHEVREDFERQLRQHGKVGQLPSAVKLLDTVEVIQHLTLPPPW